MHKSPLFVFSAMVMLSITSVVVVLALSLRQPWLGLDLTAAPDDRGLVVVGVHPDGPASFVQIGTQLVSVTAEGSDRAPVQIRSVDRIEEPDILPTIAQMQAFIAHQGQLHDVLRADRVVFATVNGGGSITLSPAQMRPVSDLPSAFWVQVVTGIVGLWLGGLVFALRQGEAAPLLLLGTGLGLALSAHAAALYSARELAIPAAIFEWASAVNSFGALLFGACMVSLFLIHPVRLVPRWLCKLVFAVLLLWAVASFFRLHPSSRVLMQFPILLEMTIIIVAATAQAFASRKNPQDRSAMRWFGLSVIIGAGSFVFLSIAPPVFGIEPVVSQGHAFALFTLIYAGVAIGVARYRLFQIEEWAFRILFYVGGVVLLLGIDVALIYFVALDRVPAFSIALIVVTFAYLPARHAIGRVLGRGKNLTQENMFDLVSDVGLAASAEDQRRSFHKLMEAVFDPIKINDIDDAIDPHPPLLQSRIGQGGEILDVPGFDRVPPFRLRWARQGRRLFGPNDERRANALLAMLRQMLDRREAYEAGAQEERQRINRDIHDNIGIQLLGALHTQVPVRKDSLIRQALTDLREIVSNNDGDTPVLDHLLADLRNEISEHLLAADILVDWPLGEASNLELTAQSAITIRAILREAAGNIIRHSGATQVWIKTQVTYQDETQPPFFHLAVRDNGSKTNPESPLALSHREGRGLASLKLRAAIMGGKLVFGQMPDGTGSILEAEFQLRPAIKGQEYAPDIYETEQKGLVHNTR